MKWWKRLKQVGYSRCRVINPHVLRELRQYYKEFRFLKSQYRICITGRKHRFSMLKRARTMMKNGMWERENRGLSHEERRTTGTGKS